MADPYRSYVVRVRRRPDAPESLRVEVEDLLGGRRNTVSGVPAEELGARIHAALERTSEPPRERADTMPEGD
jgi:hypothetical protein